MNDRVRDIEGREGAQTVRAVSRALAVLRAFTAERPSLPLAEIAQSAGLDKATARRLLVTLMAEGLVRQDPASQHYALTLGMLTLAAGVQTGGLREEARPVMEALAREAAVTVFLSVPEALGALCLERVHGFDPVMVRWWSVGQHMPWNCGAAPRLLLAYMAPDKARAALQRGRTLTPFSENDADRLLETLPAVRAQGYALACDDVAVGLSAAAVPVLDAAGGVVASLSVGGLTHRVLGDDQRPRMLDQLRAGASAISARLGSEVGP